MEDVVEEGCRCSGGEMEEVFKICVSVGLGVGVSGVI